VTQFPITAVEGEPVRIPADVYEELAREGERVARELSLGFGGVTRLPSALRFDNMIGTVAKGRAAVEVVPKTNPGQDWMQSVLDLMDDNPVVVVDDQPASDSAPKARFIDLIGRAYASRLSNALALEGPITTIEAVFNRSPMLSGRLRVGEWLERAAYEGHRFPVDRQVLTMANAYARTLAHVGQILAPHVRSALVRRQLLETSDVLAGGYEVPDAPPNAVGLQLPIQWGAYEPAWTIAQLILRQRTRFGERPQPHGMSLVIEPWILLERLLERTLACLARQLTGGGQTFRSRPQRGLRFLIGTGPGDPDRHLVPDCVLLRENVPVVNFEAKYRDYARTGGPSRGESYQAITAGRASGTSLAVLVYPNCMPPRIFQVRKAGQMPNQMGVFGLDLFGYRRGMGEQERADRLHRLLENTSGTCILGTEGEAA
jgi:hypothetical protein